MNWKHGYYADGGYTYGHYAETMPMRLRWAALIQAHQAPAKRFRYLDAGCGQGYSLILAAIAHPDSDFVGIDFLPEHIAHARTLAVRCGLTNVTFIEGDFIELSNDPRQLGEFDYAVCHGITTWIAPAVKASLFKLIGQVLKPGGIFYNSYNTFPGWLGVVPFQHMVLLEQQSKTGAAAITAAQQNMETIRQHSAGMFNALPGLSVRIKSLGNQDPAYLVQEYNNMYWQPVFVTQMMADLAAVKLSYLGTATIPEAYDAVLPAEIQKLIQQQPTTAIKEQLRDYAVNQTFRRDLYVKGQHRPWVAAMNDLVKSARLVANPLTKRPEAGKPYDVKGGAVELSGDPVFYNGLLGKLDCQPDGSTIGELLGHQAAPGSANAVVQAVSMLIHAGYIHLVQEGKSEDKHTKKAILGLAESASDGAPYNYVVLPKTGSAVSLSDTEWVMLREHLKGSPKPQLKKTLEDNLIRLGRVLAKEGKPVTDAAEQAAMLEAAIIKFSEDKLPYLRRMGGA